MAKKRTSADKAKESIKKGYQVKEDKPVKVKGNDRDVPKQIKSNDKDFKASNVKPKKQSKKQDKKNTKPNNAKPRMKKPKTVNIPKQTAPANNTANTSAKSETPIRWLKRDNEKIAKAVRRANAKATRLNKKGFQVNKLSVRDVKRDVRTRKEFNQLLKDIDKFVERGSEKGKSREDIWAHEVDFYKMKHRTNEARKAKALEEYMNEEITRGGTPIGKRKVQTGKNSFMTHRQAQYKPYDFQVKNRASFNRQAHAIDVGMDKLIDKAQMRTFRDNYIITLQSKAFTGTKDNPLPIKGDAFHLQEMIALIPPDKWDYLARTETELEIGEMYPGDAEAASLKVAELREIIEPFFEKTREEMTRSLKRKGVPESTLEKIKSLSNDDFAHNFLNEFDIYTRTDKLGMNRNYVKSTILSDKSEIINKFGI